MLSINDFPEPKSSKSNWFNKVSDTESTLTPTASLRYKLKPAETARKETVLQLHAGIKIFILAFVAILLTGLVVSAQSFMHHRATAWRFAQSAVVLGSMISLFLYKLVTDSGKTIRLNTQYIKTRKNTIPWTAIENTYILHISNNKPIENYLVIEHTNAAITKLPIKHVMMDNEKVAALVEHYRNSSKM